MKKHLRLLSILFAIPLLGGCNEKPHEHTFSKEWYFDDTTHYHLSTCEHLDIRSDIAPHSFTYDICTVCSYRDSSCTWSNEQKQLFVDHLYSFQLPYFDGLTAEWDEQNSCVVVSKKNISLDNFNDYVNFVVDYQGFSKQNGPQDNSYILLKEMEIDGKVKTIDIDIFINSGTMYAICYDPFTYEWPIETIDDLFTNYFYRQPSVEIPSINADKYFVNTSYMESDAILSIDCYSSTNLENTYKNALIQKGFTISDSKNGDGMYVATEAEEIVQVLFGYSETEKTLNIVIEPVTAWPAFVVDYYTDQLTNNSGTRVPAVTGANKYTFYENSYDQHGYFFVGCECDASLEEDYEAKLEAANYTVYNEAKNSAGNYWAISENNDLLVQYVYWFNDLFEPVYKEFDVLFEKYYPYNEEHILTGLNLIQEGTKTTLPTYPGTGAKVTFSDNYINMFVTIQSATYASISTYANTLIDLGWFVEVNTEYDYVCISPDRDIKLQVSLLDGKVVLTATGYSDPYKEWPTSRAEEIVDTLGLIGEVPVFEGAISYDYENDKYHDIVCFVPLGHEDELIEAYYEKLVGLGWRALIDGDYTYYIKEGYTIGLLAYVEEGDPGIVYVDISFADGKIFDLDARNAFIQWKVSLGIRSKVQIPGIDFTNEIKTVTLLGDEGETYENYELFELAVEFNEGSISSSLDEVKEQFVANGWSYSSSDERYHKDDVWMTTYEEDGMLIIDICAEIPPTGLLSIMDQFIYDIGYYDLITLPRNFDMSEDYTFVVTQYDIGDVPPKYSIGMGVLLTFNSATDASDAVDAIVSAFKNKDWVEKQTEGVIELVDSDGWFTLLKLHISYVDGSSQVLVEFIDPNAY